MRELSEKELKDIEECGRVAFSYREVAYHLQVPMAEVREQFVRQKGPIWEHWVLGRMQVELEIRQVVLTSAKQGSTPMLDKMLEFFKRTEREHRDIYD